MTWRTFFYSLLCFVAALVVASATGPLVQDSQAASSAVLAVQHLPTPAVSDPTRLVALVFGVAAVLLTFQKAWTNFRRS